MNKYQYALKVYSCLQIEETVSEYTPLEYSLAKDDLQELVERATPEKVKYNKSKRGDGYMYSCPKCGRMFGVNCRAEYINFCNECGQAIDWSEEE